MKTTSRWHWIPLKKRLPPEDPNKVILIWNYKEKRGFTIQADLARYAGMAILEGDDVSWDRLYSDWCYINPPTKRRKRRRIK